MALIIRMRQQGAKGRQSFRVVLTDARSPRDGEYKEKLGWYDPFGGEGKTYHLDVARIQHWLNLGACVSGRVKALVRRAAPEVLKELSAKKVARVEKQRTRRKRKKS